MLDGLVTASTDAPESSATISAPPAPTQALELAPGSAPPPAALPPEPIISLAGMFLGGLAFFFLGVDGIKTNLRQFTSRRFRSMMSRLTSSGTLAAFWGMVFGAITQSATATSFIMVGMISSGLLSLRRALLVTSWANVGTVLLVFVAAVDLRAAILYLIGVCGLLIAFDAAKRAQLSARVLLSVGILLLGLKLMSDAARPIPRFDWFVPLADLLRDWGLGLFLLGVALRLVIQSSSAIVVIGIAFAAAGLIAPSQLLLLMSGAAVGVGASVALFSARTKGLGRQIALHQGISNAAVGLLVLVGWFLEPILGVPMLRALVEGASSLETGLAVAFLVQQLAIALVGTAMIPLCGGLLARLSPVTQEEQVERTAFIADASTQDSETALVLLDKELTRLIGFMPHYLDRIRADAATGGEAAGLPPDRLLEAARRIGAEIRGFEEELSRAGIDDSTVARLLRMRQQLELALSLHEMLCEFARTAGTAAGSGQVDQLRRNLVEGLDAIVHAAAGACRERDEIEVEMLRGMTADRGELMERIRGIHLSSAADLPPATRSNLLYLTTLFERVVWMLGQLGRTIRPAGA